MSALVTKKLHQKAIDALKLSEERFETIFKDAPAGIFYYDNDLKVVESNNEMLQILQIPREKMIYEPLRFTILREKLSDGQRLSLISPSVSMRRRKSSTKLILMR